MYKFENVAYAVLLFSVLGFVAYGAKAVEPVIKEKAL